MAIKAFRTSENEKLADISGIIIPLGEGRGEVEVDLKRRGQTFLGFGGALTESACYVLSLMGDSLRDEVLTNYFSPDGLDYALARVAIGSCDFALDSYGYLAEGDETLGSFDIRREEKYVIPALKAASARHGSPLLLLASPWSPPAFMKNNKSLIGGGHLLAGCYDLWCSYMALYFQEMAERGLLFSFVTPQNEPQASQVWESCLYSAEEEGKFVLRLREALDEHGFSRIGIFVHDHNLDILPERVEKMFEDVAVKKASEGIAFHWYGPEIFANLSLIHAAYPTKKLLFTEGCVEGSAAKGFGSFESAEKYARNIIEDLNRGASGWIDWNIVLDERGGPNHVGNYCEAPIQYDTQRQLLIRNPSFFALSQFARFIKPGATVLESANATPLRVLAVESRERVIIVALNESGAEVEASFASGHLRFAYAAPPHSLTTFCIPLFQ